MAPVYILIVIFYFIAFILISEWWNVKILKNIDYYAWGIINENPWFYETPNLYANVLLVEGLLIFLFTTITLIKITKKDKSFKYWLFSCFLFIVIIMISSNV